MMTTPEGDVRQVIETEAPGRVNAAPELKVAGERWPWQEFDDMLGDITAILNEHALNGSTHLHMLRWKIRALTAHPAPSGWQQREREAFAAGMKWSMPWSSAFKQESADRGYELFAKRQNAVDALPPAPEVKDGPGPEGATAKPEATDEEVNAAIDDLAEKAKRLYRGSDGHSRGVFAEIDRKSEMLKRLLNTPADMQDVTPVERFKVGQHSNTCDLVGFRQGYNAPAVCSCGADASPVKPDPIASAVRAELQPLEDALIDAGHKLAKEQDRG